jgi:hypothetical protein
MPLLTANDAVGVPLQVTALTPLTMMPPALLPSKAVVPAKF